MTLRITAKVRTKIQLTASDPEPGTAPAFLHEWYVNHSQIGRSWYFVFTEALTLYTVILPSKDVRTRRRLEALATDVVFGFLKRGDITQEMFEGLASSFTLLGTANRRIVGSQNDLIWMAQAGRQYFEMGADFLKVNRTPMSYLGDDHSPDRAVARRLTELRRTKP